MCEKFKEKSCFFRNLELCDFLSRDIIKELNIFFVIKLLSHKDSVEM